MGPSGSGKTSLIDFLADRKAFSDKELSGRILLNGHRYPNNYRLISGYVVQDDVLTGSLTVRENILFAANLRLPPSSSQDKKALVERILKDLLLEKCANSKVGTELIKGVSGGERKRCNIGMELVISPQILFLDEPTTGLDASTSLTVMKILRNIATSGNRTIIFSVHQPRFSIFKQFDCLHLLSCNGQTVYHGAVSKSVNYFSRAGLECESLNNPPDFFLDCILKHDSPRFHGNPTKPVETETHRNAQLKSHTRQVTDKDFYNVPESSKKDLAAIFRSSPENQSLMKECSDIYNRSDPDSNPDRTHTKYAINWFLQFYYLSKRAMVNYVRNPQVSLMELSTMIILALVFGIFFIDIKHDESGFQNIYGAVFFMTAELMWTNYASVEVFVKDRNLFLHELANGYYQAPPFFFAKIATDLFPRRLFPTIILVCIFYWMSGLEADANKFFFALFVCIISTMAACGIAFFYGVVIGQFSVAAALVQLTYTINMIFGGLLMNVKELKPWIRWVNWISISRHSLAPITATQVQDIEFCGSRSFTLNNVTYSDQNTCESGLDILDQQGIEHGTGDLWLSIMVQFIYIVVLFGATYARVLFIKKQK